MPIVRKHLRDLGTSAFHFRMHALYFANNNQFRSIYFSTVNIYSEQIKSILALFAMMYTNVWSRFWWTFWWKQGRRFMVHFTIMPNPFVANNKIYVWTKTLKEDENDYTSCGCLPFSCCIDVIVPGKAIRMFISKPIVKKFCRLHSVCSCEKLYYTDVNK